MKFDGFDRHAVELLAQLPRFGEQQYAAVNEQLAVGLREPGAALIATLASRLDTQLTVERRSSVSPLHRDLRFAAAGSPRYKDHLLLTTWQGSDKKTAPTLWLRVGAESVGFASGIAFTAETRGRWREAIAGQQGEALASLIDSLRSKHQQHAIEVAGARVKRVPKPWEESHPRAELLRLTGFQIRFQIRLPTVVHQPAFADWCEKHLRELLPVHRWLVAELGGKERGT